MRFSVVGLAHPHVFEQVEALCHAGARVAMAYDDDAAVLDAAMTRLPGATKARSLEHVLEDQSTQVVTGAAVPVDRAAIGVAVMQAGKDYLVDKPGVLDAAQLDDVRACAERTGRRFTVYFHERLSSRAATRAVDLAAHGAVGDVVRVVALAPHQSRAATRPEWFWDPRRSGGILVDLGSHQFDVFLELTGAGEAARVVTASVANAAHPQMPAFQDLGAATLDADGVSGHVHVDWLSPDGLGTWGDGRLFVHGTRGYLEVRRTVDLAGRPGGDHLFRVDADGVRYEDCSATPLPFAARYLHDVVERSETALSQRRVWQAAQLALDAQQLAEAPRAQRALR